MPPCAIQYPRELPKFSEFEPFGRLKIPLAAPQRLARHEKYFFRATYRGRAIRSPPRAVANILKAERECSAYCHVRHSDRLKWLNAHSSGRTAPTTVPRGAAASPVPNGASLSPFFSLDMPS
jgi:hypothetical protein